MSDKHPFFNSSPHVMGIVNVTPDSFSDGGDFFDPEVAIAHGLQLVAEGADSLDIGGESTRPGADVVSVEDEIARVVPVIEGLQGCGVPISIDTRNARTMEAALEAGATVINDISGLRHDPLSVKVAASCDAPVIVMHAQGTPQDMQQNPIYNSVIGDVSEFFNERLEVFSCECIEIERLVLDPGIGFGKTLEHNMLIIRNIRVFSRFGCPLMLGTSRKSFIGQLSTGEEAKNRLGGSIASVLWGLSQGVQFFRVHDVKDTKQAFAVWENIQSDSDDLSSAG